MENHPQGVRRGNGVPPGDSEFPGCVEEPESHCQKRRLEDIYVLFVWLRQRKQGELRAMPGHVAAFASHSRDDDGLLLDSSAPYAHTSAPRALQRRAALSPWIESSRAGRQLQNSSWKRHRLLEGRKEPDFRRQQRARSLERQRSRSCAALR